MSSCANCLKESDDVLYISNPLKSNDNGEYWCEECVIPLWPSNVHFIWGYGISAEVKARFLTIEMLKRLRSWDVPMKALPVYFYHRRESESTKWMSMWDQRSQYSTPGAPYGYRAWCSYDHILMLVDETETPESLEWVFYHELAHAVCNKARMFDQAMERENRNEGRKFYEWRDDDDEGHEADSEERLVNRIATAYTGGKERARPWWRPRVTALSRGYTVLPDAFAEPNTPEFLMWWIAKMEGWISPLPIHGLEIPSIPDTVINLPVPSEEERKQPDFRAKLDAILNPGSVSTPSNDSPTWSE